MRTTCPGLVRKDGMIKSIQVVKDSVRLVPSQRELIYLRYVEGMAAKLMKRPMRKQQKEMYLLRHRVYLHPHGTEKCLLQPDTIQAVIGLVPEIFKDLTGKIETTKKEKLDAVGKLEQAQSKIGELQFKVEELFEKLAKKSEL